jgi:hypothetical protein
MAIIIIFLGFKPCPCLIDNISLRVPLCSIRNFTQFSIARKFALLQDAQALPISYAVT